MKKNEILEQLSKGRERVREHFWEDIQWVAEQENYRMGENRMLYYLGTDPPQYRMALDQHLSKSASSYKALASKLKISTSRMSQVIDWQLVEDPLDDSENRSKIYMLDADYLLIFSLVVEMPTSHMLGLKNAPPGMDLAAHYYYDHDFRASFPHAIYHWTEDHNDCLAKRSIIVNRLHWHPERRKIILYLLIIDTAKEEWREKLMGAIEAITHIFDEYYPKDINQCERETIFIGCDYHDAYEWLRDLILHIGLPDDRWLTLLYKLAFFSDEQLQYLIKLLESMEVFDRKKGFDKVRKKAIIQKWEKLHEQPCRQIRCHITYGEPDDE